MEGKRSQNPDPFKAERVGHPEKLRQLLGVDVLEWYHSIVRICQQEKCERVGHPPDAGISSEQPKCGSDESFLSDLE